MAELLYTFVLDGENRGYSYLYYDETTLYSFTRFSLEGGELYTNVFSLQLNGGRVLACRHGEAAWVDLRHHPSDHAPGAAYPLLLPRVTDSPYVYTQISCDDGSVIGETVLFPDGDDIVESQDGKEVRRFTMRDGVPIRIDWGGAVSILCATPEEAVAGSGLAFMTGVETTGRTPPSPRSPTEN